MWKDPIVAEIHEIRQQMLAQFGGDLRKYSEYVHTRPWEKLIADVPASLGENKAMPSKPQAEIRI